MSHESLHGVLCNIIYIAFPIPPILTIQGLKHQASICIYIYFIYLERERDMHIHAQKHTYIEEVSEREREPKYI